MRLPSLEEPRRASLAARIATAVLVIFSSIGLLSIPLGDYDDGVLLIGARLILAGQLPYLDFYSHYGPFGYTFLGVLLGYMDSPARALRIGQSLLLAGIAITGHIVARNRSSSSKAGSEPVVPLAVLGLSTLATFPSFFGFAFGLLALLLLYGARASRSGPSGRVFSVLGGAAFSMAVLIRPAFGAYVGGAVVLAEAILIRLRPSRGESGKTRLVAFLVSALVTGVLVWLLLYREIPLRVAFDASVRGPATLLAGGGRYLEPNFLTRGFLIAVSAGLAITGGNLLWGFGVPTRRARTMTFLFLAVGAFVPVLVRFALPGQPHSWIGYVLLPLPFLLALSEGQTLRESPDLAAAALLGMTAAVFGHYAWTRPDAPHLLPSLILAAFGTALVWRRFRPSGRVAIVALFFLGFQAATRSWGGPVLPIGRLLAADAVPKGGRWGCEKVEPDAAAAVALADSGADPNSRFVAVASSHVASQASPVILYVLSARPPYSKWFQYDPGVQSSPSIQREMERDLLASGSETAVVWAARRFLVDRQRPSFQELQKRTEFDLFFDRLYPETIGRFGDYEVRRRVPVR